jgi:TolB protein
MLNRKLILITACITLVTTFSGCTQKQVSNREVVKVGGKNITVINNDNTSAYNELALQKINNIKEVRAFEWIDEDTILISKENKEYPKIFTEAGMVYPQNLYLYDLKTNEAKLILGSENCMGSAVLSPDKKHIFYKEGIENLTGFILSLETKQKFQVTEKDSIFPTEGQWIDNNNVIFSALPEGKIYIADTKGKVTQVAKAKGLATNTMKIKNDLYYTVGEKLYKQEINSNERKLLREDVIWLIPSPDQSQFALVKHSAETKRTLTLVDLQGKEIKTLAEGIQIMGTSWSDDGSKLAYTVASKSNGEAGLFVVDTSSGKVVQLAVDIQYISDSVKWSPSGKRLLASNFITENNKPSVVSYIIDLK